MTVVTADVVVEGLHERWASIGMKRLLDHEPSVIQVTPILYTMLVDYEHSERGQVVTEVFTFMHRVVVDTSESKTAEPLVRKYVTTIPLAVEQDPQLGNRISRGISEIRKGEAGYVSINGTVYRIVDFYSRTSTGRPIDRT